MSYDTHDGAGVDVVGAGGVDLGLQPHPGVVVWRRTCFLGSPAFCFFLPTLSLVAVLCDTFHSQGTESAQRFFLLLASLWATETALGSAW